jgi:hypothetical protein
MGLSNRGVLLYQTDRQRRDYSTTGLCRGWHEEPARFARHLTTRLFAWMTTRARGATIAPPASGFPAMGEVREDCTKWLCGFLIGFEYA